MSIHIYTPLPTLLGGVFGLSEAWLALRRHSRSSRASLDRGSLLGFWILVPVSLMLAQWAAAALPQWRLPGTWPLDIGMLLLVAGLVLRWYSICHIGRWFTVNVAIHAEQPLIKSGPYRFVRHPSYSGALLALIGLGLSTGHIVAMQLAWLPALPAFIYRIHVEEKALRQAFGETWRVYCRHTWRLLPGLC